MAKRKPVTKAEENFEDEFEDEEEEINQETEKTPEKPKKKIPWKKVLIYGGTAVAAIGSCIGSYFLGKNNGIQETYDSCYPEEGYDDSESNVDLELQELIRLEQEDA